MKVGNVTDGYWILLQDWTTCSLNCGGGTSYQHWMCVPPKKGGKACSGKPIRTRSCNTQKCPEINTLLRLTNGTVTSTGKLIVKSGPFSSRPQRYSKCLIKDNDAFMITHNQKTREQSRMPVRIVMNNKTLTVFGDDTYTKSIYTFKLSFSTFKISKKSCCFHVRDSHRQHNFCGYDSECGLRLTNDWARGWQDDFKLFKVDCKVGRAKTLLSKDDERGLEQGFNGKLNMAKEELIRLKRKRVAKKEKKKEQQVTRGRIAKTQDDTWVVLQKEMDLENMIKKEEKEKEGVELQKVVKVLRKEKMKKKCMKKTLKKREKQNAKIIEKRKDSKEIKNLKKELAIEVELKRNDLKRQIGLMRARTRRRKAALQDKINKVRATMAKDMIAANKKGDMRKCQKGKTSALHRNNYCNANFVDNYLKNMDCKVQESFCYTCCETEFGNAFLQMREKCYNMCDGKKVNVKIDIKKRASKKKGVKKEVGGWVWVHKPAPPKKSKKPKK